MHKPRFISLRRRLIGWCYSLIYRLWFPEPLRADCVEAAKTQKHYLIVRAEYVDGFWMAYLENIDWFGLDTPMTQGRDLPDAFSMAGDLARLVMEHGMETGEYPRPIKHHVAPNGTRWAIVHPPQDATLN